MDGISVNGAVVAGTGVSAAIDTGTTCVPPSSLPLTFSHLSLAHTASFTSL